MSGQVLPNNLTASANAEEVADLSRGHAPPARTKMIDTYQIDDFLKVADAFWADGIRAVVVYLFRSSGFKEVVTRENIKALCRKGFYVVTVYENGQPTRASYFTIGRGMIDGAAAFAEAALIGQPKSAPVYFAVDYDADARDLAVIGAYFTQVNTKAKACGYPVGVYGSGLVCDYLIKRGLVTYTWLSQSKGFAGFQSWLPHANIVQGAETMIHSINVDLDSSGGNGGGWKV